MQVTDIFNSAKDAITVKRVYGEPYEKDGMTIIPAATVGGGAGGGKGHDTKGEEGEGGGFGVSARPAGAYVIKGGDVSWRPAVDPNRILSMVGFVVMAYLLSRPRVIRARAKVAKQS